MTRRRLPYETRRCNLHLRKDLVEFFEGALLAKPEEQRVGYGLNRLIDELLEERKRVMLAAQSAGSADGFAPAGESA